MTRQVDIKDELLIDPLPGDLKPIVVKRGYWLLPMRPHRQRFYIRQPIDNIKLRPWV